MVCAIATYYHCHHYHHATTVVCAITTYYQLQLLRFNYAVEAFLKYFLKSTFITWLLKMAQCLLVSTSGAI